MRVIIKRCCQKSTCSCKILRSKLIQSYNCYKQQPRGMIMGIRISDMIPDDDKMMMNINVWTGKKMKPPLQRRIFLCQLFTLHTILFDEFQTPSAKFWQGHENGLAQTIQTIPNNLYVSIRSASIYCGLE